MISSYIDAHRQFPLRLPEEVYVALKSAATYTERSMNEITVEALRLHLADPKLQERIDRAADKVRIRYREALDRLAE
jgi:hypothetical protein